MNQHQLRTIELNAWTGPWSDDDPNANLKADVAIYTHLDPMTTVDSLSCKTGIPAGALVRYILAKWTTAGSAGLLELGPSMVHRLWDAIEKAESDGSDSARLKAYDQLSQMISWLRVPIINPESAGY
jgi:hypothetical protein